MNYYELLLQALYHQIELHKWSLGRLHSKAKSVLAAGTAALSVITVGMSGFAALLAGADLDHHALLASLLGESATCVIAAAIFGIAAIIASMSLAIVALKGYSLHQILTSEEFEYRAKGGPQAAREKPPEMSEDALSDRLLRNIHTSMETLEAYNKKIAPLVLAAQILLLAGIILISAAPLVVLAGLL